MGGHRRTAAASMGTRWWTGVLRIARDCRSARRQRHRRAQDCVHGDGGFHPGIPRPGRAPYRAPCPANFIPSPGTAQITVPSGITPFLAITTMPSRMT